MQPQGEPDLLEHLTRQTGCMYLSDLRQPGLRHALLGALEQTSPDDFPPEQWQEALSYLAGFRGEGCRDQLRRQLIHSVEST